MMVRKSIPDKKLNSTLHSNTIFFKAIKNCGFTSVQHIDIIRVLFLRNGLMESKEKVKKDGLVEKTIDIYRRCESLESLVMVLVAIEIEKSVRSSEKVTRVLTRHRAHKHRMAFTGRMKKLPRKSLYERMEDKKLVQEIEEYENELIQESATVPWKRMVDTLEGFKTLRGLQGLDCPKLSREAKTLQLECVDYFERYHYDRTQYDKKAQVVQYGTTRSETLRIKETQSMQRNTQITDCSIKVSSDDPSSVDINVEPEEGPSSWLCERCGIRNTSSVIGSCVLCSTENRGEGYYRKCRANRFTNYDVDDYYDKQLGEIDNVGIESDTGSDSEESYDVVEDTKSNGTKRVKKEVRFPLYEKCKFMWDELRQNEIIEDNKQYLLIIQPSDVLKTSMYEVKKTIRLKDLDEELFSTVYVIQKPTTTLHCQVCMMFRLDNSLHGGCQLRTVREFERLSNHETVLLPATNDVIYNDMDPSKPILLNEDNVQGVCPEDIKTALGIRKDLSYLKPFENSLHKQAECQMIRILELYGDKVVLLLDSDSLRVTNKFDFGFSPLTGNDAWKSRSGGIALCELKQSKAYRMSSGLRVEILILMHLIYEQVCRKVLSSGKRSEQGRDTPIRREMKSTSLYAF